MNNSQAVSQAPQGAHMITTWRGRIGSAVISALVGGLIGWALSLTVGSNPQRWPWIAIGALALGSTGLLLWEKRIAPHIYGPNAKTPKDRKALDAFGAALRKGKQAERVLDNGTFATQALLKWEVWAEKSISRRAGPAYAGLFASADGVSAADPVPDHIKYRPTTIVDIWKRTNKKMNWLRYQIKSGPHL
jgi:hypothetical protein